MKRLELDFTKFDYDTFPFYDRKEIVERVKKSFDLLLCDMRKIKYVTDNDKYIELKGEQHYPNNEKQDKETVTILVDKRGNIYVLPENALIEKDLPLTFLSMKNKGWGAGNIHSVRF